MTSNPGVIDTTTVAPTDTDAIRAAFGSPVTDTWTAIAARDASDRAAQLSEGDAAKAAELLAAAHVNGDVTLAAAIGFRAYEMTTSSADPWSAVLAAYLTARPDAANALAATTRQETHL